MYICISVSLYIGCSARIYYLEGYANCGYTVHVLKAYWLSRRGYKWQVHVLFTSITVTLVQILWAVQEGIQIAGACLINFHHSDFGSKHIMGCLGEDTNCGWMSLFTFITVNLVQIIWTVQEGMQNVDAFLNNFCHSAFGSKYVLSTGGETSCGCMSYLLPSQWFKAYGLSIGGDAKCGCIS